MKNIIFLLLISFACKAQNAGSGVPIYLSGIPITGSVDSIYVRNSTGKLATISKANFAADLATVVTGTYNPTITNITNVTGSTSYSTTKYFRYGDMVTVFGKFQVDPTAAAATEVDISFPIASNVTGDDDVSGVGSSNNITGEVLSILAETTNHRARVMWNATDVTNRTVFFHFSYMIK